MKNSLGSLAALAAFAAPALIDAAPQPTAFQDVVVPYENSGSLDFDVDGVDSASDFFVFSNGIVVTASANEPIFFTPTPVNFGDTVSIGMATSGQVYLGDVETPSIASGYYGFSLNRSSTGTTHAGWFRFDFSGPSPLITGGAWESVAGASITVGAIPEPSSAAALAGLIAVLGVATRRRRRPFVPAA